MGKLLTSLLLTSLFFFPGHRHQVVDQVSASVVRLNGIEKLDPISAFFSGETEAEYVCSGFVVETNRVLTAAHCIKPNMRVDGLSTLQVLKVDPYDDLALINVQSGKGPLTLATEEVKRFEEVKGIGYGEGFTKLLVTSHLVEIVDYTLDKDNAPGIIVLHPFIGGMSGGPIINDKGEVVGVIQKADENIGYGVNATTIRSFLLGTHDS